MTVKVYHYDPITFEYLGEENARIDPLDNSTVKYLVPANATLIIPSFGEGKITTFIVDDQEWILQDPAVEPEPTEEELFITLKAELITQRQRYLVDTLDYLIASLDDNVTFPLDSAIQSKRITARTEIIDIEAETTLVALETYDNPF